MRPRHAEGGAERRARGLRRAAGMRPLPVRRRRAGSFPLRFARTVEALTVTGAVFAGIGALVVLAGIAVLRSGRAFDRRAVAAPGEVTDVRWRWTGPATDKSPIGYPIVRFTLPDGRVVETEARSTTTFDVAEEGRSVSVLYDPDDPAQARVAGRAGTTPVAAAALVIGGMCLLLGVALLAAGIALDDALPAVIRS
jgi:hypothetical protein